MLCCGKQKLKLAGKVGEQFMATSEILLETILFCMVYILKLFCWISSQHFTMRRFHIRVSTWDFCLKVLIALNSDSHVVAADGRVVAALQLVASLGASRLQQGPSLGTYMISWPLVGLQVWGFCRILSRGAVRQKVTFMWNRFTRRGATGRDRNEKAYCQHFMWGEAWTQGCRIRKLVRKRMMEYGDELHMVVQGRLFPVWACRTVVPSVSGD